MRNFYLKSNITVQDLKKCSTVKCLKFKKNSEIGLLHCV